MNRVSTYLPTSQTLEDIKCTYLVIIYNILFFPAIRALHPVKLGAGNLPVVNTETMQSSHPQVWFGGDIAGVAETTVESVNDGKTAAWYMHCFLEVRSLKRKCNK